MPLSSSKSALWYLIMIPSLAFFSLWFSDRAYNYTFVSDVNAHIKGFAEAVLPMPLNNKTQVVLDGFAEAVIRPSMEYRRWSLVAHIWTAGTGAIAMILNLMPWVRTRSYALHRALGYYAVMAVAITCVHLMTIWTVFGQVPVGFWASAGTPLICTEMAACVVLGYRAAVKRDWMAHRAAMMFCAAGMLYIPTQRFIWTVLSKNNFPWAATTWTDHRYLYINTSSLMGMVINNAVAWYFAFHTTPRDARVQAVLKNKAS